MVMIRIHLSLALLNVSSGVLGVDQLQSYKVDKSTITVSGFSTGGTMAMQYHVAFSSEIQGAAIFAGAPYAFGNGGLQSISNYHHHPDTLNVSDLVQEINALSKANKIDNHDNLNDNKVFVYRGKTDTIRRLGEEIAKLKKKIAYQIMSFINLQLLVIGFYVETIGKLVELYKRFGAATQNEFNIEAAHGFPTNFYGGECDSYSTDTHYINNCNYHGFNISMSYLLGGSLAPPASSATGQLLEYDQTEFGGNATSSMDTTGYIYVPKDCQDRTRQCKLHIAFHGCDQSKTNLNDIYATKTGMIEVAEANNIIVLFPQAAPNELIGNPITSWDWWGYLDANFLNKEGAQMKAVHAMQLRVCSG